MKVDEERIINFFDTDIIKFINFAIAYKKKLNDTEYKTDRNNIGRATYRMVFQGGKMGRQICRPLQYAVKGLQIADVGGQLRYWKNTDNAS